MALANAIFLRLWRNMRTRCAVGMPKVWLTRSLDRTTNGTDRLENFAIRVQLNGTVVRGAAVLLRCRQRLRLCAEPLLRRLYIGYLQAGYPEGRSRWRLGNWHRI